MGTFVTEYRASPPPPPTRAKSQQSLFNDYAHAREKMQSATSATPVWTIMTTNNRKSRGENATAKKKKKKKKKEKVCHVRTMCDLKCCVTLIDDHNTFINKTVLVQQS